MKITSKHPDVWPEHCKCTPYVDLEVGHEEAVREGVRQLVCIKVGMDETKEDIVGFPAFVGQEADDTGEVDASQQSHQNESLDNQPSIKISSKGWLAIATLKPMACQPFHKNFIYENVA